MVAAVVGALLGFVGAIAVAHRDRREAFAYARRLLVAEIDEIERRCTDYVDAPEDDLRINPPLPALAWQLVVSSGQLFKLRGHDALVNFYRVVEEANYLGRLTPAMLQSSKLAPRQEDRTLFLAKAVQLSREPYQRVLDDLPRVRKVLG